MPVARCNDCSAYVSYYCHAGRKLRELLCPCGGELTSAPYCRCSTCDKRWYHRIDAVSGKRVCDHCIEGKTQIDYPRFNVQTTRPVMRSTKTQTVNKDEWTRLGSEGRGIVYTHVSGQWEIRKLSVEGCLAKKFCPIYIGPKRSVDPHLPWSDKLFEAQLRVVNYIKSQRENLTARHRAIQAQQDGDAALVLDCIFDHIDQKFEELQDELDRRFDRLRISFQ